MPFSVEENKVFIALQRHRMIMGKGHYDVVRNGYRYSADMVHSLVYNKERNTTTTNKLFAKDQLTHLQHILFAKYGCTEAFRILFNVDVRVIDTKDMETQDTEKDYVFTTIGQRPSYHDRARYSEWGGPTTLGLVISKEECTEGVVSMVGGFFYVLDLFSDYFPTAEYVESTEVWQIALGNILFNKEQSEGFVLKKMEAHIASLDHYLDITKAKELAKQGIVVNDFYEFCARMLSYVPKLLRETSVTTLYGKRLSVLNYLMYHLVYELNSVSHDINKTIRDKGAQALTMKKVNAIFNIIKPHSVIKHLSGKEHPEVLTTSLPNDMPSVKITNQMIPQAKAKGGSMGSSDATKDRSLLFDASLSEVASMFHVSKGEGTGRNKLNLMVQVLPDGTIVPRPEFQVLIQSVNKLIGRKVYPPNAEVEALGMVDESQD